MEELLRVGIITSTHGIKGEVKVFPTTDNLERFKTLKKVILVTGKENFDLEIESTKFFKQYTILKFKGYDSINDIEKYRGRELYVDRKNADKLKKDEYYIADLLGMKVVTEDQKEFGTLKDVLETGANDVYIVDTGDKEVLLPAIKECIKEINLENNTITVHIMEGLLD